MSKVNVRDRIQGRFHVPITMVPKETKRDRLGRIRPNPEYLDFLENTERRFGCHYKRAPINGSRRFTGLAPLKTK